MRGGSTSAPRRLRLGGALALVTGLLTAALCAGAGSGSAAVTPGDAPGTSPVATVTWDTAHDVSPPLRDLAANRVAPDAEDPADEPDLGPMAGSR